MGFSFSPNLLFSETQFVPVARLDLLGGQFFFEGEHTSFSGNGDWSVTPGLKFSDRFSLLPTVMGKYRRVREVQELIGGGFLTRETLENTAILKGMYALNGRWKVKAKGSFKDQLLVESADEKLGKGLFDNDKLGFGLEMERTGSVLRSLRFSADPYAVRFPRYASLASGSEFGTEIDSGENTLDFNAYDGNASAEIVLFNKTQIAASLLGSYRPFIEQRRVTSSGEYTGLKRKDVFGQASLGFTQILPALSALKLQSLVGLDFNYSALDSDQHNYDASRTRFNPDYYDYLEYHIAPKLAGRLFGKLDWAAVYDYGKRSYNHRNAQADDGGYLSSKIELDTHTFSYSFKYPVSWGFSVIAQGVYRRSKSNMAYEKTYRYNYVAQHYFAGLSWEY